jgi:Ca2+-binding EF-hand superfamily protein
MLEEGRASGQIKLIDFGYASHFEDTYTSDDGSTTSVTKTMTAFVGTAYATSPEVYGRNYTSLCDLWSLGVVTYSMLCGSRPFNGYEVPNMINSKYKTMVRQICSGAPLKWGAGGSASSSASSSTKIDEVARDFVERLLVREDRGRMDAKTALKHPFITNALVKNNSKTSSSLTPLIPQIGDYDRFSDIKKRGMMAVAFGMSQSEINGLRDTFCSIDTDHSGTLTQTEFSTALRKVMPNMTDAKIYKVFGTVDVDGDGEISYLEFLAATMKKNDLGLKELHDAFNVLDTDNSGFLELQDFNGLLTDTLDSELRASTIAMLAEADADGDGKVSFAEFMIAMSNADSVNIAKESVVDPVTAGMVMEEKRKVRMKSMRGLKRHNSDSILQIEDMRNADDELQKPSDSTHGHGDKHTVERQVAYKLHGQKSDDHTSNYNTQTVQTTTVTSTVSESRRSINTNLYPASNANSANNNPNNGADDMIRRAHSVSPNSMGKTHVLRKITPKHSSNNDDGSPSPHASLDGVANSDGGSPSNSSLPASVKEVNSSASGSSSSRRNSNSSNAQASISPTMSPATKARLLSASTHPSLDDSAIGQQKKNVYRRQLGDGVTLHSSAYASDPVSKAAFEEREVEKEKLARYSSGSSAKSSSGHGSLFSPSFKLDGLETTPETTPVNSKLGSSAEPGFDVARFSLRRSLSPTSRNNPFTEKLSGGKSTDNTPKHKLNNHSSLELLSLHMSGEKGSNVSPKNSLNHPVTPKLLMEKISGPLVPSLSAEKSNQLDEPSPTNGSVATARRSSDGSIVFAHESLSANTGDNRLLHECAS